MTRVRFASAAAFSAALLSGCAATPLSVPVSEPVSEPTSTDASAPDTAQIIQQRLAAAQTAGITDLDAHSPVETLAACETRSTPSLADPSSLSPELTKALAAAKQYSDSQKGKGLVVMHQGRIIHESYAPGVTADTPFVSHSLHKSLLGLTVLAAIDDGIIGSLDDQLGEYIPEWSDDPRGAVTLRQAMQMASGLTLYSMSSGDQRALDMSFGTDLDTAALGSPLTDKPGEVFTYNNANAQIIGIALSNALRSAGKGRYSDYLRENIWCPLGNSTASLRLDRAGGSPQYFAGVHASLRDWAKIGEAIRSGKIGKGDAPKSLPAMISASPANPNYGLFLWLGSPPDGKRRYSAGNPIFIPHSEPYTDEDMAFMDGFGGQRVYISRSADLVIARFGEVSFTYDDAIIPNLISAGL